MTAPAHRLLDVVIDRGVATLRLSSPSNRNALSAAMRAELRSALASVLADDTVRVVVLDHVGRVFCSGMDLAEAEGGGAYEQGVNELPTLLQSLWGAPKPVVCALRGAARGGGVGLAAACDIVVAARAATLAFSEVRIGVVPAVISAVVLPRMSVNMAHRLMLTGETVSAAEALQGGLVDLVVDADEVDACVASQVSALVRGGPLALQDTKRLLRLRSGPLDDNFPELLALSARHFAGPEGQEGIAAFRQKRPARWVPDQ